VAGGRTMLTGVIQRLSCVLAATDAARTDVMDREQRHLAAILGDRTAVKLTFANQTDLSL